MIFIFFSYITPRINPYYILQCSSTLKALYDLNCVESAIKPQQAVLS